VSFSAKPSKTASFKKARPMKPKFGNNLNLLEKKEISAIPQQFSSKPRWFLQKIFYFSKNQRSFCKNLEGSAKKYFIFRKTKEVFAKTSMVSPKNILLFEKPKRFL
jgi:hypothetical protein